MRESDIQSQVLDYLRIRFPSAFIRKVHLGPIQVGNGRRVPNPMEGFPDILMIHEGRFYGWEIKMPGKKPSLAQKNTHQSLRAAGAIVATVDSIEAAKSALAK